MIPSQHLKSVSMLWAKTRTFRSLGLHIPTGFCTDTFKSSGRMNLIHFTRISLQPEELWAGTVIVFKPR